MPLVSIVMPAFNSEKYLPGIFDMFADQTGGFELVVVSDGSTDGTAEMFRSLQADCDFSARLITTARGGAGHARNAGIAGAAGDYIAFVDSDDTVTADYLKHLGAWAGSGGFDVTLFRHERLHKNGNVYRRHGNNAPFSPVSKEDVARELLLHPARFGVCDMLVRRDFLLENKIRFDESVLGFEDYEFIWRLLATDPVILRSDATLYRYTEHENSGATRFSPARYADLKAIDLSVAKELLPGQGQYAADRLYWSMLLEAARHLNKKEFRAFAARSDAAQRLKNLRRFPDRRIGFYAGLYRISPLFYTLAARFLFRGINEGE